LRAAFGAKMNSDKTWTKAEQDAAIAKYRTAAIIDLAHWMIDHAEEINEMGDSRHDNGYDSYGDEMFHWDKRTWMLNIIEELADARNYTCAGYARGWTLR
jgi:hypothetical protein